MDSIQDTVLARHGDLVKRNQEIDEKLNTPLTNKEISDLQKEKKKNEAEIKKLKKIIQIQKLTILKNISDNS